MTPRFSWTTEWMMVLSTKTENPGGKRLAACRKQENKFGQAAFELSVKRFNCLMFSRQ